MTMISTRHPRTVLLLAASGTTLLAVQIVKALLDVCPW